MSAFEDMNRFLEERLDEFLKSHPTLELQVLEDQLREQGEATQLHLRQLAADEKETQQNILKTAQEVQRWHERIAKAQQAHRPDLVAAAQEREAAFLRQGNQQWAHMALVKEQIQQGKKRAEQIAQRRQDVQAKIRQGPVRESQPSTTPEAWQNSQDWTRPTMGNEPDPIEEKFKAWEMEEELAALKRKLGR